MEQSAEVEENNRKSDCPPLSKSSGSLIRIDTISIDLDSAMDKNQDANQCDHFSLRGYVTEMRKKDISVCLPFSTADNKCELEDQKSVLPPLDVVKFKWWSCHNCLHNIGAQEIGKVSDCLPSAFAFKGLCSITQVFSGAVKEASAIACTEVSRNEILVSPCGYDEEMKDKVGQSIPDGSENDTYHQMGPVMKDIVNSKASIIPERHAAGSDVVDFSEPSFRGRVSSNIRHLEDNGSNYAQVGQTETSFSANSRQRMEIMDCQVIPNVNRSIGNIEVAKGKTNASRSVDGLSSESVDIYSKNDKSVSHRAPKIRLLTEILGSDGNDNQSRTTDSDSDSASDFCDDMTVQTNPKKLLKGKRKTTQGVNGKSKLLKGYAILAKRNCMVVDSNTEEKSGIFIQPKNLKNQVSNKKKHKHLQREGEYPKTVPCPDAGQNYHNVPHEEQPNSAHPMYSNNEMSLYYKSSISLPQADQKSNLKKKNKQFGVWQAVPVPQWSTRPNEGSSIRKDYDPSRRKSVDLSFDSYEEAHKNETRNIAKCIIGDEPFSHPWNSTLRERCQQVKNKFNAGESSVIHKSPPNIGSGKDFLCDLNEKIATQSSLGEMQNDNRRIRSIQHHQELNMSGIRNSEPKNDDQDKGNEDIPMEIVELMAKIQYDRRQHESARNYFSQERISEKRSFESMGLPRAHGNGILKSYQIEEHGVRKYLSRTTTVSSSENLAPLKVNPIYLFSECNETSLNINKMEGKKSAFARCSSFFDSQGTQSGRVSYPNSGSIRNGNYQNFQWRGDPNHTKFPQSFAPQASNFLTGSPILEASSKGRKMAKDIDLNIVDRKYNNFEKQNRDFGSEYDRKSSSVNSFASKDRGIDLNASLSGSLDVHSNEAIPAMQLLSLMDAGMKSKTPSNSAENQNLVLKPFSPCDYHPKTVDKPPFLYDHRSQEAFGRAIGVSSNESRPSSSSSYSKVQWRYNSSCECPPSIPSFGPFPSPFQIEGNFIKVGNGIPTRVPSKFEGKKKGPARKSCGKLQKPWKKIHESSSMHTNQGGYRFMSGNFFSSQSLPKSEVCFVNRNPADFSTPERGNMYMISGRDFKFGKKISSKGKNGSVNVDGKKRQRVKVLTATKTQ